MRCPSLIPDEPGRLRALEQYGLCGTRPLASLEPIVRIAAQIFDAPAAAVNMIGRDEVFFAASFGIGEADMRRDVSFCAHAITQDHALVVRDASLDERFHDNPLVTRDGGIRFYAGVPILHPDGHAIGALCVIDSAPRPSFSQEESARLTDLARLVTDKLELRRIEVAGHSGVGTFEQIALTSPHGIITFDQHGVIKALNRSAAGQFGWDARQIIGAPLEQLLPAWRDHELPRPMASSAPAAEQCRHDLAGHRADGSEFPAEIYWSAWFVDGEPNFGVVVRDISDQRLKDNELYSLANFDQASGLPNRNRFGQQLTDAIEKHRSAAVLAIGVRGVDDLIATRGQDAGDAAFRQLADRARACIRPIDILARLGPDTIGLLMPGVGDPLRSAEMANAILATVGQPLTVKGSEVRFDANCGIVLYPVHGGDGDELLGSADLALKEAHKQSPGRSCLYTPVLRAAAVVRGRFEADIHRAVKNEELELYYQAQVRLSDDKPVGAEALIRWNHPERGLLAPADFLPALEESGLAATVGTWVIDTACRKAAEWRHILAPSFRMSINLFDAQLRGGGLRSVLASARKRYALPAGALELEITETTALADHGQLLRLFRQLRADGLDLAFDDFGTGFASLSLLSSYPLSHLKIDKCFVQDATHDSRTGAIVEAITNLAHRFNLNVIAEGVETQAQLQLCRDAGCDEVQGYLFGHPVSATDFAINWMSRGRDTQIAHC